jgi:hypothetical protein
MNPPTVQLTRCPECDQAAEIEYRSVLDSSDGPIEHLKIRCINRHWFHLPVDYIESVPYAVPRRETARHRP